MEEYKKEANCKEYPQSCKYSYSTSYKVKYNSNGKFSIIILDSMYSGGAHGLSLVTTYNFNLKTGRQYKLSDILTTKTKFEKVTKYAKKYMVNHPDLFFPIDFILNDFKVTNSNPVLLYYKWLLPYFSRIRSSPYAAGHPIIKVPSKVYNSETSHQWGSSSSPTDG